MKATEQDLREFSKLAGRAMNQACDAGFPKDKYRLLCHNCNQSMGWYGYCPHQKEKACG